MFLLDYAKNRANILTVMKISKVANVDEFRQFLIQKITYFQRCRSKLVKLFSEYYFKEMFGKELQEATKSSFKILQDETITSDDDIIKFLEKEQTIRDPLDTLQYKIFIVENFNEHESLLILKSHHSMCDGIATLVMTSSFARDSYSPDKFHQLVPRLTLQQKVQLYLTLPYSMYLAFMCQMNQKLQYNEVY